MLRFFDTAIAIMAGLMIIPAVFAFSGGNAETLKSGPALMFITIPKVFANMGFGTAIGVVFFLLVLFAAVTSSIALTESAVSTFEDELHWAVKNQLCSWEWLCYCLEHFPALVWTSCELLRFLECNFLISSIS